MRVFDALRPPSPLDSTAGAYKDWLHLNFFDHPSASVGLVNVSLHGPPSDPRSRAIGTALVHHPDLGWRGNVEVRDFDEAAIGVASLALDRVAIGVNHGASAVLASAALPDDHFALEVIATAAAPAIDVEAPMPLGPGWISWYALPRLGVEGWMDLGGDKVQLAEASAYFDHNWGRWHWGQDLGWEWGAFLSPTPGPALVFTRVTDQSHDLTGPPQLTVQRSEGRRRFAGAAVEIELDGVLDIRLRRLPGAQAALHHDRSRPRLPARVKIQAEEGDDRIEVDFTARAAAQLVAGDPSLPGYGFIHELVGDFTWTEKCDESEAGGSGLGVFEYVD